MTSSPRFRSRKFALRIVRPLVPRAHRARWLKEWEGESVHWRGPGLLRAALRDAIYLRLARPNLHPAGSSSDKSPQDRSMFRPLLQDIRYGFRTLRSAPGFSLITILTLALGIGASVAMYGVLHSVFLKPLPFPQAERLVIGRATFDGEINPYVAGADYYDYREESESFQELAAILPFPMDLTARSGDEAERVPATVASANLFAALGVQPAAGRLFQERDGAEGAPNAVLLSHSFWQSRLGGDPEAVGDFIDLDGTPYTVVGILPQDFFFLTPAEIWFPMRPDRDSAGERHLHNWYLVGRLAQGVRTEQAQAGVDVISARLQEAYPESNENKALLLTDLRETLTEDYRQSLWILTAAVALVLLIACGNGAGIFLSRAPTRRFELSVRSAMGAPRDRLIRQLLIESLILALASGVLGTVLAFRFQGVMLEYLRMEQFGSTGPEISRPVLAAALGFSLLAGLLAGVYPALRGAGGDLTNGLKTGHRSGGDAGSGFRSGLVVAQVALSVVLLAGSGLLVRSLTNLQTLDPGFDAENLLTAQIQLPSGEYPDAAARTPFVYGLRDRLQAIPGVKAVGLTTHLPIADGGNTWRASRQGNEEEQIRVFLRPILPGYRETMDIPLLSGRDFQDEDQMGTGYKAVLSRTAAERLFPEENALGRTLVLTLFQGTRDMEVVGVVGDVRLSRLEEEAEAALYIPYAQWAQSNLSIALKAGLDPASLAGILKETLKEADSGIPLSRIATMESLLDNSMGERRVVTLSLTLLALLPLLLASVGLFAVLAYHVSRRRHEMGIRMALGAQASSVGKMILKQGLGMVGVGVLIGLGGALAATRLLGSLLFGVEATDPMTLAGVSALVLGVAVLACVIPAWRAVRSDPTVVLQAE